MFALGVIIYVIYALVVFNPTFKTSSWYVWLGLLIALLGNLVWMLIAKSSDNSNQMMFYALLWDSMVVMSFVLVPVFAYGVKLSLVTIIGIATTTLGLIVMKLGSS